MIEIKSNIPGSVQVLTAILAARLATMHNLWLYHTLIVRARQAIAEGRFAAFKAATVSALSSSVNGD